MSCHTFLFVMLYWREKRPTLARQDGGEKGGAAALGSSLSAFSSHASLPLLSPYFVYISTQHTQA
jgi:hypothetical protein